MCMRTPVSKEPAATRFVAPTAAQYVLSPNICPERVLGKIAKNGPAPIRLPGCLLGRSNANSERTAPNQKVARNRRLPPLAAYAARRFLDQL
jgi:hypothetical protein